MSALNKTTTAATNKASAEATDKFRRHRIELRYKTLATHRKHLGRFSYAVLLFVVPFGCYLATIPLIRDGLAPPDVWVASCAALAVTSYCGFKISYGKSQAKQEKTMAMMIAIVNIIVVALFSQSLFVVHRMLKAQQRTYVVFSQAIMEIVLAKYPNVDRDTMAAKILNYVKPGETLLICYGMFVSFLTCLNATWIHHDLRENGRDFDFMSANAEATRTAALEDKDSDKKNS